jgi:penicillin-binding protein 1A
MNVPSLRVLDGIGFDAAINRAAALLDITDPDEIRRTFPRVYPLGLGIISASPLKMARAFAVFANQGRAVTPIAIRSVEDRNGRVILDPERELRLQQRQLGEEIQVISPQNAFVMTSMLKKTVEIGTLANPSGWGSKFTLTGEDGKRFRMPMAGKTGTPQNWSDAWTVGFSAYYTTAIWFGFDKPGNSLGVNLTGSTLAGPVWADYMREIHQGLAYKDFIRPASGVIDVTVCAKSGLLKTSACNEGDVTLPFLEGTQPSQYCNVHGNAAAATTHLSYMRSNTLGLGSNDVLDSLSMPVLDLSSLPQAPAPQQITNSRSPARSTTTTGRSTTTTGAAGNRLLDGDDILYQENTVQESIVQETPSWDAWDTATADEEEDEEEFPFYNPLFE